MLFNYQEDNEQKLLQNQRKIMAVSFCEFSLVCKPVIITYKYYIKNKFCIKPIQF